MVASQTKLGLALADWKREKKTMQDEHNRTILAMQEQHDNTVMALLAEVEGLKKQVAGLKCSGDAIAHAGPKGGANTKGGDAKGSKTFMQRFRR